MEPTPTPAEHEAIDGEAIDGQVSAVHEWRAAQLRRLGFPRPVAEADADAVDWHQVAALMQRGCPPQLALRIVR
jgi:hypothetical protein